MTWEFILTQVGSVLVIISTLIALHRANVKTIKEDSIAAQNLARKVETVHQWLIDNGADVAELKVKVDLMYATWQNRKP